MTDKFTPTTPFQQRMAQGHLIRTGHKLTGYYVPTADEGIVKLIRTCCDRPGHVTTTERAGMGK